MPVSLETPAPEAIAAVLAATDFTKHPSPMPALAMLALIMQILVETQARHPRVIAFVPRGMKEMRRLLLPRVRVVSALPALEVSTRLRTPTLRVFPVVLMPLPATPPHKPPVHAM